MTSSTKHDFRSDTVTLPTPAMRAAIVAARLGDAARGDDPTVAELERLACLMTGKDDALFLSVGGNESGGPLTPTGIRQMMVKAGRKAGIQGVI